jgi:hypothetical protein
VLGNKERKQTPNDDETNEVLEEMLPKELKNNSDELEEKGKVLSRLIAIEFEKEGKFLSRLIAKELRKKGKFLSRLIAKELRRQGKI